jgi:hypothetical protein
MGPFQRAMVQQIHGTGDDEHNIGTRFDDVNASGSQANEGGVANPAVICDTRTPELFAGTASGAGVAGTKESLDDYMHEESLDEHEESLDDYMHWWSVRKQIRHQMKLMMQAHNPGSYLRDVDLAPEMIGSGPAD